MADYILSLVYIEKDLLLF